MLVQIFGEGYLHQLTTNDIKRQFLAKSQAILKIILDNHPYLEIMALSTNLWRRFAGQRQCKILYVMTP